MILGLLFASAAGALGGVLLTNLVTGAPGGHVEWFWTTGLILLTCLTAALWLSAGSLTPPPHRLRAGLARGRGAVARVVTAAPGTEEEEIAVVVAPDDGPPYRSTVSLRAFEEPPETGDVIVVVRDRPDRPRAWWLREPDAAWRAKAEAARDAAPHDAPEWTPRRRPRTGQVLGQGIVAVLAAAGLMSLHAEEIGWGLRSIAAGEDLNDMTSGPRQAEAVAAIAEAAGTTSFTGLHLYQDGRVLATVVVPGETVEREWQWDRGRAFERDVPGSPVTAAPGAAFEVTDVDWHGIAALRLTAIDLLGLDDPDETWLAVERHHMPSDSGASPILVRFTFDRTERIEFTVGGEVFE
ncbi:hypothetical protein LX16_4224 [Stackebrandtia albiflava]|uniref:Uncharacterized protein n=1 Tax=Stackebrandtia albiflava TaxID=406432 RepID=A0A562UYT8_9ACTN|nr:hypothetical protein [Stackebrandtia albiflava]TWJ10800.1 hypothetical protein LX16_4224 [Stackebrandtia albiflava]